MANVETEDVESGLLSSRALTQRASAAMLLTTVITTPRDTA
jgi:hypothetical protein